MKELHVTVSVRNNRLLERRKALGMSQARLAEAAGLALNVYVALETLRTPPLRVNGKWRDVALRVARFHCVPVEDLFPAAVLAVQTSTVTRTMDGEDLAPFLLTSHQEFALAGPEVAAENAESRQRLSEMLATLRPFERKLLAKRFGLDGDEPATLEQVGSAFGICRERARYIETQALGKLAKAKELKP